jgi:hypothetical protein
LRVLIWICLAAVVLFTGAVESRSGMRILPDRTVASWSPEGLLPPLKNRRPAEALDQVLVGIADRYGRRTASLVAMQLEYPQSRVAPR